VYSRSDNVSDYKCLGTTLTNENCVHEEIKSTLNSGNPCYHSFQNFFLSSLLLSKNLKIKIYKIMLRVVLYQCET
jgi:hypothetical protein